MAAKTTRTVGQPLHAPPAPKLTMIPAGAEERGKALLTPLRPDESLAIQTQEEYEEADALLGRVRLARKNWKVEMYGPDKDHPGPIPLARATVDALYELNNRFDKPMEAKEEAIKKAMKAFKVEEDRQRQLEEDNRQAALRRLQAEADALAAKAVTASTPQLAGRLANQASRLDDKIEEVKAQPITAPVQAIHSANRMVKKWRVRKMSELIAACAEGTLGPEWVSISPEGKATLDQMMKSDPDAVAAYPGIEVYDDIRIVGR